MRPMTNDHIELDEHGHDDQDHGDGHGHGHGHGEPALGPIDVAAWGAGALGVVSGVLVAVCFAIATAQPV